MKLREIMIDNAAFCCSRYNTLKLTILMKNVRSLRLNG